MGAGHGHRLHWHGHGWLHRARPEAKLVGLVAYAALVVATPSDWRWVHFAEFVGIVLVIVSAGVPLRFVAPRLLLETPVLVFAAALPFVAHGPDVEVVGVGLSRPGLEGAYAIVVKATLGLLASLTVAATTQPVEILAGLRRLRMPAPIVAIMGFMVRYVDVVTDELSRMLVAMRSRGLDPRSPRQWPALGRALGALFLRSYERGERVHLAMVSRGFEGSFPAVSPATHHHGGAR